MKWEIIIPRNIDPSSNKRRPRKELTKKVLHMTDINHGYFGANSADPKFSFLPQLKAYTFCFGINSSHFTEVFSEEPTALLKINFLSNVLQLFFKLLPRAPNFEMTASAYRYVAT